MIVTIRRLTARFFSPSPASSLWELQHTHLLSLTGWHPVVAVACLRVCAYACVCMWLFVDLLVSLLCSHYYCISQIRSAFSFFFFFLFAQHQKKKKTERSLTWGISKLLFRSDALVYLWYPMPPCYPVFICVLFFFFSQQHVRSDVRRWSIKSRNNNSLFSREKNELDALHMIHNAVCSSRCHSSMLTTLSRAS